MRLFQRFLRYLLPYRSALILAYCLILVWTGLAVASARIFGHLLNEFEAWRKFTAISHPAEETLHFTSGLIHDVYLWGAVVIGVSIVRSAFGAWRSIVAGAVAQRVVFDVRNKLLAHVTTLSLGYFELNPTGQIMSRLTSDVDSLQMLVTSTVDLSADMTLAIVLGGVLVWLSPFLAFVALLTTPLFYVSTAFFGKKMRVVSRTVQAQLAEVAAQLLETVTGMRVVMGFSAERRERRRFFHVNAQSLRLLVRRLQLQNIWAAATESGIIVAVVILALAGIHEIVAGRMRLGDLGTFTVLLVLLPVPIQRIAIFPDTLQRGLAAAERVFEVFDTPAEVASIPGALPAPRVTGDITFDHVGFAYNTERSILHDISLTIPRGSTVAVVGPSGAGKSTMANLLIRFYDPSSGEIRVDGVDIRTWTVDSWRRQIGLVLQETFLFSGTARDNIAIGRVGASEDDIHAAAVAANADEFLRKLPKGYGTAVGERGAKLSGGERQRIAIARAILRDPPILILDEATSSLDTVSERLIQDALDHLLQGRTALVIAHRLSTVQRADRIVVLDDGRIQEEGTHEELLARNGLYAHLYHTQLQAPPAKKPYTEPGITEL